MRFHEADNRVDGDKHVGKGRWRRIHRRRATNSANEIFVNILRKNMGPKCLIAVRVPSVRDDGGRVYLMKT